MNRYSKKEVELLSYFGAWKYKDSTTPFFLYSKAAESAFLKNCQGPEAESLRRCVMALGRTGVSRLTPEWDAMIQMD